MIIKKRTIKAIAYQSYINCLFSEIFLQTILDKKLIKIDDINKKIDQGIKEFSANNEAREAFKQIRSLVNYDGAIEDKINYFRKTGRI